VIRPFPALNREKEPAGTDSRPRQEDFSDGLPGQEPDMKAWKALCFALLALGLTTALPAPSSAQDKEKKEKKKGGGPIILDEIIIEGRVQKPQAFYILQRSTFGYKITEIEENYIDEVVDSVKDDVF